MPAKSKSLNPEHSAAGGHDHGLCLDGARVRAEEAFEARGMKLTPLRRQVFEEIAGSHDAVGAYDVLDRLARKTGERMAPVSVYRAIDALLAAGVVHRLEMRNAFFACHAPHVGARQHIALVCEQCGCVAEVDGAEVVARVGGAAKGRGFEVRQTVIEVAGRCAGCANAAMA